MAARFAEPEVGCVVGKLMYVETGSTAVGRGESVYWRYEGVVSSLESKLKSVLVANGSIFAARRELLRELYDDVANDFQIPMDIGERGYGVVYEGRARAVERTTVYWQEEFDRKVRIILRGLTGFSRMRHRIRGMRLWQFWSRKLLRWMVGFFLLAALGANVVLAGDSLFYTLTLALQAVFYFAAINGWLTRGTKKPRRSLYVPFYFTMVNASAAVAIVRFLFGHRQRVWDKAESTRVGVVEVVEAPTGEPEDVEANAVKN
jgi:cellulose synthase/poly-beta-1,6-N-acetylglucosamine synthase-like glycosyltransferase